MKELFKRFGLNDKEIKTFLKLLELGAQPVSVIAKHVGIPRTTMYLVLEELKKAQLVEEFERADITYFKCIPAENLINVLRAKESLLKQTESILYNKLPELEALENKLSITPSVKFFEGRDAIMQMYESVLQEGEIYTIFNPDLVNRLMPEYYFKIPEIIRENNIEAKELIMYCDIAPNYQKKFTSKNHKIKILPKSMRFESDTIICPDKIYMISYGEKTISATEIYNRSLAKTQIVLFKQLWKSN